MRAPVHYGLVVIASYFVAWTAAYMIVMYYSVLGLDFSQYFTWLVLARSF